MTSVNQSSFNYTDFNALNKLLHQSESQSPEAIKLAAQQFESLFIQMVLKSMREANKSFDSGLFSSSSRDFYEDLYDKQLSLTLSGEGGVGLSAILEQQLSQYNKNIPPKGLSEVEPKPINPKIISKIDEKISFENPKQFVKQIYHKIKDFSKSIPLEPKWILAQSALETGWGKYIIKDKSGNSSNNLFNIKADADSQDNKIIKNTIEYENGTFELKNDFFKMYHSLEHSIKDYVNFLNKPRYLSVLKSTSIEEFSNNLKNAGYATDPEYPEKIMRVYKTIEQMIP